MPSTDHDQLVGPALRVARERAGLTRADLATALGCSYAKVRRVEIGVQLPPAGYFTKAMQVITATLTSGQTAA